MKRLLTILALCAPLVACSSRERSYSDSSMPSASSAAPRAEVARGSDLSAEQVRLVQRALSDKGFSTELNGMWDDRTRGSLMSFQRSVNLAPTGHVNAQTAEALGLDPQQVMPVRGQGGREQMMAPDQEIAPQEQDTSRGQGRSEPGMDSTPSGIPAPPSGAMPPGPETAPETSPYQEK